MMQSVDKTI